MNREEKVTYTPAEFAALFGKSQSWAYRQLYAGKINGITEFGRVMIPASEVEKVLGTAGRYLGATTKTAEGKANAPESTANPVESSADEGTQTGNPFRVWLRTRQKRSSPAGRPHRTSVSAKNWSKSRRSSKGADTNR